MKQCKIADKDTDTLNAFCARFEQNTTNVATPAPTAPEKPVPSVTALEVRFIYLGVNPRKVTGPDSVPGSLHSSLEHLDNKDTYVILLLIGYSSVFNTIIPPPKLISKLCDLGLGSTLCNCILSFLTHRLQSVRV
eukprot:g21822.t1